MRNLVLMLFLAAASATVFGDDSENNVGFVLLKNHTVLPGNVVEEPGYVVIRDGESVIRLPRDRVACWAGSIAGLHRYMIDTREGSTLPSHLYVARWCIQNQFPAGAVAELVAARRLDPENKVADLLEQELRDWHARKNMESKPVSSMNPGAEIDGSSVSENHDNSDDPKANGNDIALASTEQEADTDFDLDDSILERHLAQFTRDVQPILLNRCGQAGCHGSASGNANERRFNLDRPFKFDARPNATMSRRNLANVFASIDFEHLEASPLLVKALQPHAELECPPLKPQDRIAADQLRTWIMGLASEGKHLLKPASRVVQASPNPQGSTRIINTADSSNRVVRVPEIDDPFDPEVFNRRFHSDLHDQ